MEKKDDVKTLNKQENQNKPSKVQNNKNNQNIVNYLKIVCFKKGKIEEKEATKLICVNTSSKTEELILMPESNQEVLKYNPETIISPISISKRGNYSILNDYKIIKPVTDNTENKKAV